MSAPLNKRQRAAMQRDDGGFTAGMIRHHILDVIGDLPRNTLAMYVAIDMGDDELAHDLMSASVEAMREAAKSWNEYRAEMRKGAA